MDTIQTQSPPATPGTIVPTQPKPPEPLVMNDITPAMAERVLVYNDLTSLTPAQRLNYYRTLCQSLGLNHLSRPFEYIQLNGRLTLYARKDATDQLRKLNGVSVLDVNIQELPDSIFVRVYVQDATGRKDVEVGVVSLNEMGGNKANITMKAVTKAKRRATLSICGLGMLDETEVETIKDARPVFVNDDGVVTKPVSDMPQPGTADAADVEQALLAGVVTDAKTGRKKFNPALIKNTDAKILADTYASLAMRVYNLVDKNPADPIITAHRVNFDALTYEKVSDAVKAWNSFVNAFETGKDAPIDIGAMKVYDAANDDSAVIPHFAPYTIKQVLGVYDGAKCLAELPADATYKEIRETLVSILNPTPST